MIDDDRYDPEKLAKALDPAICHLQTAEFSYALGRNRSGRIEWFVFTGTVLLKRGHARDERDASAAIAEVLATHVRWTIWNVPEK